MDNTVVDKEMVILDLAKTVSTIDYQIAELQNMREELSKRLAALLEHSDNGQCTYKHGRYSIVCKSGYLYSLDKEEYEIVKSKFTPDLNPVKIRQTYEINRDMLRKIEVYGSDDDKLLVESLISVKPSKLSVKVNSAA